MLGEKTGLHDNAAVDARLAGHLEKVAAVQAPDVWQELQGVDPICWSVQLANGSVVSLRGDGSEEVETASAKGEKDTSRFGGMRAITWPELAPLALELVPKLTITRRTRLGFRKENNIP